MIDCCMETKNVSMGLKHQFNLYLNLLYFIKFYVIFTIVCKLLNQWSVLRFDWKKSEEKNDPWYDFIVLEYTVYAAKEVERV